jgi:OmpA-OmpF porin, OOP family
MLHTGIIKRLSIGVALLATACTNDVALLENTKATGDKFTNILAQEYKQFATYEAYEMVDWKDAEYFASKGLAAAKGETVKPERPSDWNTPQDSLPALTANHRRLVAILETGVRQGDPRNSAKAQARFDCWVEQQEENWQQDHIAACKSAFEEALEKLENSPEVKAARFTMVLFPFDSAKIITEEMQTMASLIKHARELGFSSIEVAGHTDRRGTDEYNLHLSRSRADAVGLALAMQGVPKTSLKISAHGEAQPRVATADGIEEPLNRRVEIWLQKPQDRAVRVSTAVINRLESE